MLYKIAYYIFKLFPSLKKWFWKRWYTIFASRVPDSDLKFMNYGYFSSELNLNLNPEDKKDRYSIQLYHHVTSPLDLKGLKVLEVGSGRGGGLHIFQITLILQKYMVLIFLQQQLLFVIRYTTRIIYFSKSVILKTCLLMTTLLM